MLRIVNRKRRGFTLIELLIVVANSPSEDSRILAYKPTNGTVSSGDLIATNRDLWNPQ
jgi:hypothetical protein